MTDASKEVFIFGAGGLASEVALLIEDMNAAGANCIAIAAFVVSKPGETTFMKRDLISEEHFFKNLKPATATKVVLAIGTPSIRRRLVDRMSSLPVMFPLLVHPSAQVNRTVRMGDGVVICSEVLFTANVVVGSHTYLNHRCSLGHDVVVGDFVQINPHACISGNVTIGDETIIGAGSVVHAGIHIGAGSTVGIGSAVLRDVPDSTTVIGNPARRLPGAG